MRVFGISFDTVEQNRAFAEKFGFPYPLLCDVDRAVGVAYGAADSPADAYPRRITYVIGADGKVAQAIETKDPAGQADALLAGLRAGAPGGPRRA